MNKTLSFADFCATRRVVDDLRVIPELVDSGFESRAELAPGLTYGPDFPLYIEGPDPTQPSDQAYILTVGNSSWAAGTPSELEPELYAFYLSECADTDDAGFNDCFASAPDNRYWKDMHAKLGAPQTQTPADPCAALDPAPPARPLPESIPFKAAFLIAFGQTVENGYSMLDDDDLEGQDPDEVREQFDMALSETADRFSAYLPGPLDAERLGQLGDLVLETWTALNEFLIATTDREA